MFAPTVTTMPTDLATLAITKNDNTGLIIGTTIGCIAGVILLMVLIIILYYCKLVSYNIIVMHSAY